MDPFSITDALVEGVEQLAFGEPVTHVYNPLDYARASHDEYLGMYGKGRREALLIGMNPGPWGMAQTGVPFGEVAMVRDWMGVTGRIGRPRNEHPKRPVQGFACPRSEVSGARLWGWARDRFGAPERFFERFFVINYCPLSFLEASGRNRTPDKLPVEERQPLFEVCDGALDRFVKYYEPKFVLGIGKFAEDRINLVIDDETIKTGRIAHPSPANPAANRDWAGLVEKEFAALGAPL